MNLLEAAEIDWRQPVGRVPSNAVAAAAAKPHCLSITVR